MRCGFVQALKLSTLFADKLAESKQAGRDAKLRHQAEQQAAKGKKEEGRLAEAAAARVGREFSGISKRHVKDTKEVRESISFERLKDRCHRHYANWCLTSSAAPTAAQAKHREQGNGCPRDVCYDEDV